MTRYNELLTVEKDIAVGVGETLASNSIFDNSEEIASVKINGVEAYNNGQISLTSALDKCRSALILRPASSMFR